MTDEEVKQEIQEEKTQEAEITEAEETKLKLPFPTATVVREMKKSIGSGKIIRKEVKIAMNQFLGEVVKEVASKMNENPYSVMDLRMFNDAIRPYKQVKELKLEKTRLNSHLNAIVQDCMSIQRDLDSKFENSETHREL